MDNPKETKRRRELRKLDPYLTSTGKFPDSEIGLSRTRSGVHRNQNQGYIQPPNQGGMNLQNQRGIQPQNKKPTFDQKNVVYKLIYDNKDAIFKNILQNAKIQQRNTTKNMVQQRNTTNNMVQQRNNFHILETFITFSKLFIESTKEIIIKRNLEFADGNKALYNLQTGEYLDISGLNIDNLYLVEDNDFKINSEQSFTSNKKKKQEEGSNPIKPYKYQVPYKKSVNFIMYRFNTYGSLNFTEEFYLINPKLLPKTFLSWENWKNYTEPPKKPIGRPPKNPKKIQNHKAPYNNNVDYKILLMEAIGDLFKKYSMNNENNTTLNREIKEIEKYLEERIEFRYKKVKGGVLVSGSISKNNSNG